MDIRVESDGFGAQIELLDLSQGGQAVECSYTVFKEMVGIRPLAIRRSPPGGVSGVGVEDFKDALPLWGDL